MEKLIKEKCFNLQWLKSKSRKLSGDPVLLEKTLHAFALLGYLVQLEENFVFKGGTSLLLHVSKIKRLSIDIDIIYGGDIEIFNGKLVEISTNFPFTRLEEDKRGHRGLPNRRHFKFFYNSTISKNEEYVLLDIVLENPVYIPFTELKLIKTDLFDIETDLSVKIPTIEGLLGDKLTAFAPNTIGVPYETKNGNSMVMQVVKQLYDIGELFDIANSFNEISIAYRAAYIKETGYKDNDFSEKQVLQDTIDTCHNLLQIRLRGYKNTLAADFLEDGIRKINSHLLDDKFTTDTEAKITAAKVFCIANFLLNEKTLDFNKSLYKDKMIESLAAINLPAPFQRLNRLKQIIPEAFYYIWLGIEG